MTVFKNILVPVDGSEHSNRAIQYASEIAAKFKSKLTLLHVYSFTSPISYSSIISGAPSYEVMTPETIVLLAEKTRKDANQILIQSKKIIKTSNSVVKSFLKEGRVVPEILKLTKEEKVDLIVMGARGIGGIKKLFLGSTSDTITKQAICPVLIVK